MQIHTIDCFDRRDVERFIDVPFHLYRNTSQWVPPLRRGEIDNFFRHQHPFFQHSAAELFVAERNGEALGRLAVMDNRRFNEYNDSRRAFFGFFEAVESFDVAEALFERAFAWARERGLEEMSGPAGLSGTLAGGFLVEGFEYRPALMIPYNFDYYDPFLQRLGFETDRELLSGRMTIEQQLPRRLFRIAEKVKKRRGFHIKSFSSKREMREWIPRVRDVYRIAFLERHDYYPATDAEFELMAEDVISIARPELMKLVLKGEQIVGFLFAYPDISRGLQKSGGRLWPLGWFHLLRARRNTKLVNLNGVGLLPEYQGLGANAVLYTEVGRTVRDHGFTAAEFVQIGTENFRSKSDMETMGVRWHKRHRTYKRTLQRQDATLPPQST